MTKILTLDEAAVMLHAHPDTVSEAIKLRGLPAAKVGRAYLLLEDDVIAWLRTQYHHQRDNGQGEDRCVSTVAALAAPGGSTSPSRAARALTEALAPRTKPRRGSGPPRLTPINGGANG